MPRIKITNKRIWKCTLTTHLLAYVLYTRRGMVTVHFYTQTETGKSRHTRCRVSATKKDMWHTSVLFTGTTKSPFSTPHISITTGFITIQFTYFMLSIYTTLHAKFEGNQLSNFKICISENCPIVFIFFLLRTDINNFEPRKNNLPVHRFPSNLVH